METIKKDVAANELVITRLLNAPRELVFEAWTDPDHIKHWWGPIGFTNTIHTMEVKKDGVWEFVMHGPDGTDYRNKSIYKEIIKPERIVFEHVTGPKFTTTVTFEAQGNKTFLTWRMTFESEEHLKKVIKEFKADQGLKQNVEKLEAFVVDGKKPFVIEKIYDAPVSRVWKAITDKEEMKQWYFPDLDQFKAEVGNTFQFTGGKTIKYVHLCKVTEVIANKKISYTWRYKDYEGGSIVTFELFPEGNKTKLRLTHGGLESFQTSNPDFAKESFANGWGGFVNKRLKEFVEEK